MDDWPAGRARHGGVDEIPLPDGPGRLWLCGKHFVGPDPDAALAECGADRIVCLCERPELEARYPRYVSWLDAHEGDRALWFPVPDLHVPEKGDAGVFLRRLRALIHAGHGVLMHCGAGIGRAGTLAAALLMQMGVPHDEALRVVAAARPAAGPEAGAQAQLLEALAGQP
jgi:protein-tyrosine phosphatase